MVILLLCCTLCTQAQDTPATDTLSLTLANAEKAFLENNFQLLAARFQVNAAEAAVLQARLWDNPVLSIDQGAYNQATGKWFDASRTGQTTVAVEQVFSLAGKRNKRVALEKINAGIAQNQFYDLMRTLRYELHTSFFSLYFLRQSIAVYDQEIQSLRSLIEGYKIQYENGNIPFKELARLRSLKFNMENERLELLKRAAENQNTLILLTGDKLGRPVKPIAETSFLDKIDMNSLRYGALVDTGLSCRYDLQIAASKVQLSQANLSLQRSLRMPDLAIGGTWDRQGSYIENYNSVTLGLSIPLWDRNQGNIKAAKFMLDESKVQQSQAELEVRNDISKAYTQLMEAEKVYTSASKYFMNDDYEKLIDGIVKGYKNKTINLLEFIDYYETYKNSKTEMNLLLINRLEAMEYLNFVTGKNWFNY